MNILPLILALVLMLSVLTIEKLEKFKNQSIVQKEYQTFLKMSEMKAFNQRQEKLYELCEKDIKQLSFRFFVNKKTRIRDPNVSKQYRMLNLELMKILYGEARFFKELEQRRPNFLEELGNAIEKAADEAPEKLITRVKDIARLHLDDPELQNAFYHMLKGTVSRKELQQQTKTTQRLKERSYPSLFTFINYKGADAAPTIEIQKAPREILKAIFLKDEIVEAIISKRQELAESEDSGASQAFQREFIEKRRTGIEDKLLNFKITKGDKKEYN
ncbi:MAG: hypothetical protein ACH350_05370 [Parachlamydiaceae bacterium]